MTGGAGLTGVVIEPGKDMGEGGIDIGVGGGAFTLLTALGFPPVPFAAFTFPGFFHIKIT